MRSVDEALRLRGTDCFPYCLAHRARFRSFQVITARKLRPGPGLSPLG